MLSRPTTEQILLDCCRELMNVVLPALADETAQVSVIMIETALRNTAVRAAHEVAWMREETAEMESYARAVAEQAAGAAPVPARPVLARFGPRCGRSGTRRETACTSTTWWRPTAGPATPCPPRSRPRWPGG